MASTTHSASEPGSDTPAYLLRRLQDINDFFLRSLQSLRTPSETLVEGAELTPEEIDERAVLQAVAAAEAESVSALVADILTEQLSTAVVETVLANDPPPHTPLINDELDTRTDNVVENGATEAEGGLQGQHEE